MKTQRHCRTIGGSVARQLQALEKLKARIGLALSLPLLVLIVLLDPASGIPVARAANITAPALHLKATQASDKVSPSWPSDPVLCDLVLEGVVEEGDAAALEKAFASIVGNANAFSFFLCLRSDGGDLAEAVKVAQFLLNTQRPSIATVVEDGKTCASACAIIFLAGNLPARVGAWPQRFLHPRGKLLFHSSHIDLDRYTDKQLLEYLTEPSSDPRGLKGKIIDLYKGGLRDVQSVIATYYQVFMFQREELGDRWVRPSLFLEMFAQDPDEWICVDNVDAVGRWNIQVFGYQPPRAPMQQDYYNVCRNAYHWRLDEFAADADDVSEEAKLERPPLSTLLAGRNKAKQFFDDRVTMVYQAPLAQLSCVVEIAHLDHGDGKKQFDAEIDPDRFLHARCRCLVVPGSDCVLSRSQAASGAARCAAAAGPGRGADAAPRHLHALSQQPDERVLVQVRSEARARRLRGGLLVGSAVSGLRPQHHHQGLRAQAYADLETARSAVDVRRALDRPQVRTIGACRGHGRLLRPRGKQEVRRQADRRREG